MFICEAPASPSVFSNFRFPLLLFVIISAIFSLSTFLVELFVKDLHGAEAAAHRALILFGPAQIAVSPGLVGID